MRRTTIAAALVSALSFTIVGLGTPAAAAPTTIQGWVFDDVTNAPVAGACVSAYRPGLETPLPPRKVGEACTDATGAYRFDDLPTEPDGATSNVKLVASAPGYTDLWYLDRLSFSDANGVPLNQPVPVNFHLYLGGTLSGQILTHLGEPAANRRVFVYPVGDSRYEAWAYTDAAGFYAVPGLKAGKYQVQVIGVSNGFDTEYVPNTRDRAAATVYEVTSGGTLVAPAHRLLAPLADLAVTVLDDVTGAPVPGACAEAVSVALTCAADGVIRLTGLKLGAQNVVAHGGADHWPARAGKVLYTGQNDVTVRLTRAGTIRTRLVSAGDPTKGVRGCVYHLPGTVAGRLAPKPEVGNPAPPVVPRIESCSGEDGWVTVGPVGVQPVNLFVRPDAPYGAQWLGHDGKGTGDQDLAKRVWVTGTAQTALAPIRLDLGGAIAGTVYPYDVMCASPLGVNAYSLRIPGVAACTEDGSYRLDNLGPYAWPVQYRRNEIGYPVYVGPWSGYALNRRSALPIKVTSGKTFDAGDLYNNRGIVTLVATVPGRDTQQEAYLSVYDATTGDLLAENDVPSWAFEHGVDALPTKVLLRYRDTTRDCWYYPPAQQNRTPAAKPVIDLSGAAWSDIVRGFEIRFGDTCRPGSVNLWFPDRVAGRPVGGGLTSVTAGQLKALVGRVAVAAAAATTAPPPVQTPSTRYGGPTQDRIALVKP
ncbi:hypothetical protein CS0771_14480 [Catellatospora sp. IY07-71]|uniref:MSCRAMM family protein n=1 Tax=Catellatospora sp. IY07-71 TaxID=2728827 RepID=UPI001BB38061|nr:carboxypeptidase-like regulatory domain-containing protein [Catellatospora sp. IY07-71]BCJ71904.1 hypothetical protein CS0771_14480 [Catellatospora sp. IY07-71]